MAASCAWACFVSSKWTAGPCSQRAPCEVVQGRGTFTDSLNSTGWGHLKVESDADELGTKAAGVVEGYLTAAHVASSFLNNNAFTFGCLDASCVPAEVTEFMEAQEKWARKQIADHPTDRFWQAIGGVMSQYDGMQIGVELAGVSLPKHWRWLLNGIGDLFQIKPAVVPSLRPDWHSMSRAEKRTTLQRQGHCSALIKVLPGLEDLFMGHSSWFEYANMDRIFKYYELRGEATKRLLGVPSRTVSFSSYPGCAPPPPPPLPTLISTSPPTLRFA